MLVSNWNCTRILPQYWVIIKGVIFSNWCFQMEIPGSRRTQCDIGYCSTGLDGPQNLGLAVGITLIYLLYSNILQVEWVFQVEASFSSNTSIPLLERYPYVFHWMDRGRKRGCSRWSCVDMCMHSWDTVPGVIFHVQLRFSIATTYLILERGQVIRPL
jgi:hypothetical protein